MSADTPTHTQHSLAASTIGVDPSRGQVDLTEVERFLHLLDAGGQFTFHTFRDSDRAAGPARFPRVLHGTLDQHAGELVALNKQGAGIFVMVNAGDGVVAPGSKTCRTAANVKRVRALFVDLDGAPIAPVLTSTLPPDWVVQSSRGRWHAYWAVDDCPLGQFAGAQAALAAQFYGDPSVKDLPRVMRIPGFLHRKDEPFLSELYLPTDFDRIAGDRLE